MNVKKAALLVLVLVMISVSCNLFTPGSPANGVKSVNIDQSLADLPVLDLEAPLPSPGAALLQNLAADEPGVSALIGDVEAAEQAAMQAAIADLKALLTPASNTQNFASLEVSPFATSTFTIPSSARQSPAGDVFLVSFSQPGIIQPADGGLSAASILGLLTSMFSDYFALPAAMPTKSFSETEKAGNVTSEMSMEIGKSQDGSSHFGLGFKNEGTENGVKVNTEMSAIIDGQRCPNADGQVSFSVKARIRSQSSGADTTQDLTTFVRATVGDDAEITSTTLDITQGTREVKAGRNAYVETGITYKYKYKGGHIESAEASNWREIRTSQQATPADIRLVENGNTAAVELAMSSLASAMHTWQNGGCTKIVATSPGTVQPGSTTAIPVNVISIFDGSNAPSKLVAALTGGASIDPTSLAKTPGTLTYTAPNEAGKSATILLTATSKRGKAKLELTANTGEKKQSYQVIETPGLGRSWKGGCIDDLTKPFTLFWTAPESSGTFEISPSSSTSGSITEKLHTDVGGTTMDYEGSGSYTIIPTDKDPEGNLVGMDIAYSTTGSAISCAGGYCVTTKIDSGEGVQIPLRVQEGACSDQ